MIAWDKPLETVDGREARYVGELTRVSRKYRHIVELVSSFGDTWDWTAVDNTGVAVIGSEPLIRNVPDADERTVYLIEGEGGVRWIADFVGDRYKAVASARVPFVIGQFVEDKE